MHETEVEVYVDEEITSPSEKLSVVRELPESSDMPRRDEDYDLEQVTPPINSISEKVDSSSKPSDHSNDHSNDKQVGRTYSASPTFSDFSS
ncbi:hypothetical protein KPH14_004794 [Odynerus spinipes]|uniref:Uncharacterized protein n=1 Tax=Odynerus spinipes TaxID=1348599 RepID=A0AAD9RML2_9HYME|nr:hypothetical protein KPH14_004794 [Odynerus spinipes]